MLTLTRGTDARGLVDWGLGWGVLARMLGCGMVDWTGLIDKPSRLLEHPEPDQVLIASCWVSA